MAPWIDPQQKMPVVIRDARALRWTAQKMPRAARGSFLFVPDGVQLQEHIVVEASNCTRRILLLFELVLLVLDSGICWQTIAGKCAEIKLAQVLFFSSTFVVMADGLMAMATTRSEGRRPTRCRPAQTRGSWRRRRRRTPAGAHWRGASDSTVLARVEQRNSEADTVAPAPPPAAAVRRRHLATAARTVHGPRNSIEQFTRTV